MEHQARSSKVGQKLRHVVGTEGTIWGTGVQRRKPVVTEGGKAPDQRGPAWRECLGNRR